MPREGVAAAVAAKWNEKSRQVAFPGFHGPGGGRGLRGDATATSFDLLTSLSTIFFFFFLSLLALPLEAFEISPSKVPSANETTDRSPPSARTDGRRAGGGAFLVGVFSIFETATGTSKLTS